MKIKNLEEIYESMRKYGFKIRHYANQNFVIFFEGKFCNKDICTIILHYLTGSYAIFEDFAHMTVADYSSIKPFEDSWFIEFIRSIYDMTWQVFRFTVFDDTTPYDELVAEFPSHDDARDFINRQINPNIYYLFENQNKIDDMKTVIINE